MTTSIGKFLATLEKLVKSKVFLVFGKILCYLQLLIVVNGQTEKIPEPSGQAVNKQFFSFFESLFHFQRRPVVHIVAK